MRTVGEYTVALYLIPTLHSHSVIGTPFYLMKYVPGRIFKSPALSELEGPERSGFYTAMCQVLAAIHSVDIEKVGLQDFGKEGREHSCRSVLNLYPLPFPSSPSRPSPPPPSPPPPLSPFQGIMWADKLAVGQNNTRLAKLTRSLPWTSWCHGYLTTPHKTSVPLSSMETSGKSCDTTTTHATYPSPPPPSLPPSLPPSPSSRLDNMIFAVDRPQVLAVLDWELSTLGDPISDLAYCCMMYHLPADKPHLRGKGSHLRGEVEQGIGEGHVMCFVGVAGLDPESHEIPSEEEFVSTYCRLTNTNIADLSKHWNFYLAFTFFRVAAILQGVYKRSQLS